MDLKVSLNGLCLMRISQSGGVGAQRGNRIHDQEIVSKDIGCKIAHGAHCIDISF
jgi:hypothetical protein